MRRFPGHFGSAFLHDQNTDGPSRTMETLRLSSPDTSNGRRGLTLFCTGLPAAGKSTLAAGLAELINRSGHGPVTLLDGDVVRRHLSSELGFSRQHRDLNILRIAFVAAEIARHGGITICAAIAPYRGTRRRAREIAGAYGRFAEIYLATPLSTCETRDPKGMYARARAGLIESFTGVNDPYEAPEHPEITIDTSTCSPDVCLRTVYGRLQLDRLIY